MVFESAAVSGPVESNRTHATPYITLCIILFYYDIATRADPPSVSGGVCVCVWEHDEPFWRAHPSASEFRILDGRNTNSDSANDRCRVEKYERSRKCFFFSHKFKVDTNVF